LNPILGSAQSLEVGITSIVQTTDGKESYWALTHPGSVADFHLRQSFILELEGRIHPSPESLVGG